MTLNKVTTGQPFTPQASTWNAFIDAAKLAKMRGDARGLNLTAGRENNGLTVMVRNDSGAAVDALSILSLGDPIVTPTDNETEFTTRAGFSGDTPASTDFGNFCVTAESIPSGEIGLAWISGIVPVQCQFDYASFPRCDIDAGTDNKLLANFHGSAEVVWKEAGTGTSLWAAVKLGQHANVRVSGKASGAIVYNSYGAVTVYNKGTSTGQNLETVYLDWMHGDESVSSGKEVIAEWFAFEKRWRITNAECE